MSKEITKNVTNSTLKLGSKKKDALWGSFGIYVFLVLGAVIMILPLVWMLESSLKTKEQFLTTQLSLAFPSHPQWGNFFKRIWQMEPSLQRGILNSIIISFSTIIIGTFVSSLAAFAYSKLHFPGKNKLFLAELATMMIPFSIIMIPQFVIYAKIGWLDTWAPLIIPGMLGNVSMIFFLRQYMNGIPTSMIESARIDGAGYFRIYLQAFACCFAYGISVLSDCLIPYLNLKEAAYNRFYYNTSRRIGNEQGIFLNSRRKFGRENACVYCKIVKNSVLLICNIRPCSAGG